MPKPFGPLSQRSIAEEALAALQWLLMIACLHADLNWLAVVFGFRAAVSEIGAIIYGRRAAKGDPRT